MEEARKLAEAHKDDIEAQLRYADLSYRAGEFEQSESAYARAQDIQPDHPLVIEGHARFALLSGEFDTAERLYAQIPDEALEPSPERLTNLSFCAQARGDGSQAQALLERARELDPDYEPAYVAEAQLAISLGNWQLTLIVTNKGLSRFPDSEVLLEQRAQARFFTEDYDGAEGDCTRALELDDGLVDCRIVLSNLCLLRGDVAEAETILLDAVEAQPDSAAAWIALASVYQLQQEHESAFQCLGRASEIEPDNWLIFQLLANLDLVANKPDLGLEHTQTALDLGGGGPGLFALRGTFLAQAKRLDEAKECFEKAIELNREDGTYWVSLAEVELARAKPDDRAAIENVRGLVRIGMERELTENATTRAKRVLARVEALLASR